MWNFDEQDEDCEGVRANVTCERDGWVSGQLGGRAISVGVQRARLWLYP